MCYFLYGGVNVGVNNIDFEKLNCKNFSFLIGRREDIIKDINDNGVHYRITNKYCDCDTAVGKHVSDSEEIKELVEYIKRLKNIRKIKWVCISKKWWDERVEDLYTVHIDDIDLPTFLAEIKDGCLYKIQLFPRY
jgi:hypothetical protein